MVHVIKNLPTLAVSLDGNEKKNRFFCSRRDKLKYPRGIFNLYTGKDKGCLSFNSSNLVTAFDQCTLFGIKLSIFGFKKVNNQCGIALNVAYDLEPMCDGESEKENSTKDVYKLELSGKECLMNSYTENLDSNQPSSFLEETKNAVENGVIYLEEMDEEVLSKRILKLSRLNKPRSSLAIYKSMIFSGLKPDLHACNSLLSSLLRNGMLDNALKVFNSMKASELTTGHTYSLILKAVADARGYDTAINMFGELISSRNLREQIDIIVYNTMISIFAKANNWDQAQKIWKILKDNGQVGTTVTYRLLICTFVRCGQNELAIDAYSEMIQNGLSPESDTMHAIIGAYSREGKYDSALNTLRCMLDSELKPNARACNAVINSLGKAGKVKLAFEVYDMMKSLGHAPDVYTWNSLLNALNRATRYCDALQLFERIRNIQSVVLNVHIFDTVLTSCHKLGLWDKAIQVLWQMEASELPVSTASYNQVIGACEVARRPKVALQVYYRMVRQKHSPDIFTLLSLMRIFIWGSLWNEAVEILKFSEPNGSLYNAAIQGMCLTGKLDLAKKLYTEMRERGLQPDGKTRAMMLQNLQKNSRRKKKTQIESMGAARACS
ncbi:pentatricopeptide repeat-containing protein At3g29290 isoform X2 [Lycium barbarum]|uniref:pentatricopeptide repeat-containing protein At3g29290 isoform X2 n=1 Tax=Lycium barbarum TaxID=112863 RepID=UPI00293E2D7F|nr:pentatricopeptide repeat-containing protein At3g29290 isoform X2 [Lycium barbarum]XP_060191442.1 pentatricopeptide repeat-containing protein At3g29290 isoform X2 [Lycium barbarum]